MLFIFDWDGTLSDSESRIVLCMQEAAADVGLAPCTRAEIKNIIGLAMKEAIETLYPNVSLSKVGHFIEAYSAIYQHHDSEPCQLFPDVLETLEKLLENQFLLAVATGKSRSGLNRVLSSLNLETMFHFSRCADETASKPNPLMLNEILKEACLDVTSAVMIGDTEWDMKMADNAGMRKIAVDYGAHESERLRKCQPDLLTSYFSDVASWRFS